MEVPDSERATRPFDRGGLVAALVLAIAFGLVGWGRHVHGWSSFDLAFFDHAAWLLSEGQTESSLLDRNVFSDHLSVVLVLFAPLYRLHASPAWLIAAQSLALGCTVLPMRAIARSVGASPVLATALIALSPALLAAAVFDFHNSALAVPWIAVTVLGVVRDDRRLTLIGAVGVVVMRADLGVVLLALLIVAKARTRPVLLGLGLLGAAAGAFVPEWLGNPGGWEAHFAHLGSGPSDAVTHPWRIVDALTSRASVELVLGWVLAVGGLVLLRPRWLLCAVAAALPVLVSGWPGATLPWFHYGAAYAPILITGALLGARVVATAPRRTQHAALALGTVGVVLALVTASSLSPDAPHSLQAWRAVDGRHAWRDALAEVQPFDTVSASDHLAPQVGHREDLYLYPSPFARPAASQVFAPGYAPAGTDAQRAAVDVVIVEVVPGFRPTVDGFQVVYLGEDVAVLRRTDTAAVSE